MKNAILFIILLFVSCGARKTNKSEENLQVSKKDTVASIAASGKTETVDSSSTTKTDENVVWDQSNATLSPIDPDKPMVHTGPDGKTNTYTNANVNFGSGSGKATKQTQTVEEKKTVVKDTAEVKINTGSTEDIKYHKKDKITERKASFTGLYWIGGIVLLIGFLFFLWRRRKK